MAHIWGKRIGTTGLATVLTLLMAACGGQSAGSDPSAAPTQGGSEGESTKVLEVWLPAKATDGNDAEIWDEVVAPFEEEHNVDVTFQFISWKDYEAKYSSGISTGTGPDVGYMYVEMFPTYIDAGAVEDLSNYLTEEDYATYTTLTDKYKIFGKFYGIAQSGPQAVSGLVYNKTILDSIGEEAPKTWDDVIRIAQKATQDTDGDGKIDQYGVAQGWGQTFYQDLNWNWYNFIWQAGGDIFDDEGKCIINSEQGIAAAQLLYDLKNTYNALPEDTMSLINNEAFDNYFVPGNAALAFVGTSESTFNKLADGDFEYGFTYDLQGPNGDMGARASVDQIVLMSACEDKELGWELVKYMTGPEGGAKYRELTGSAPSTVGEEDHGYEVTKEALAASLDTSIRPIKAARRATEVYDFLWKTLQEMMNGNVSPEDAMNEVAEFANSLDYAAPAN